MKSVIKQGKLNQLGDVLIDEIKANDDIFKTLFVVVPSMKIEQWFKAYWLSKEDAVLMNVKFININSFFKSVIKNKTDYKLAKKENIRDYLIKIIATKELGYKVPKENEEYIYNEDGSINEIKLFDLANKYASLFSEYEDDNIDIVGYQKELYDKVIAHLENHKLTTLKRLYETRSDIVSLSDKIHIFGFNKFSKLQEEIINEYSSRFEVVEYTLELLEENKVETTLISAPNKVREIEVIHSIICNELLKDQTGYSDYLVLATDISSYESAITRVFMQDERNFPSISHVIIEKNKDNGDITAALKILYEILNKGFFTRLDFFDLVNNPVIQKARNIDTDLVNAWLDSIIELNIYRDRPISDDWDYLKKRLILSKLSDINRSGENILNLRSGEYLPYSTIAIDDESMVKFVKVIDDLKSWLNTVGQIKTVSERSLFAIKDEFDKWFSIKDDNDIETNLEYRPMKNLFYDWASSNLDICSNKIPTKTLLFALMEASKVTITSKGAFFTSGVTFTNYDPNAIISAKHIFFIGLDSNSLPSVITKSEIDIRDYDLNDINEDRNSFFKQYQNAGEHFYISYVNKDLKKDENFYPSTFVIDLYQKYLSLKKNKPDDTWEDALIRRIDIDVSIDEKGSWSTLFTKREIKNKEYYLGLLKPNNNQTNQTPFVPNLETPSRIKTNKLADYLIEPLSYKVNALLGSEDEVDEKTRDEYEPFELNKLDESVLLKDITSKTLRNKASLSDVQKEEIKHLYILEKRLPDISIEERDLVFSNLLEISEDIRSTIHDFSNGQYEVVDLPNLKLISNNKEWELEASSSFIRYIDPNNNIRYYFDGKKMEGSLDKRKDIIANNEEFKEFKYETSINKLFRIYILSLMDIASLYEEEEKKYEVSLMYHLETNVIYKISPNEARDLLNLIFVKMNDYIDNYYLYANMLFIKDKEPTSNEPNPPKRSIQNYDDFLAFVYSQDRNGWKRFKYANLFDKNTQIGWDRNSFALDYKNRGDFVKSLIKFID